MRRSARGHPVTRPGRLQLDGQHLAVQLDLDHPVARRVIEADLDGTIVDLDRVLIQPDRVFGRTFGAFANAHGPVTGRVKRSVELLVDPPRTVGIGGRNDPANCRKAALQRIGRRRTFEAVGIFFSDEPGRQFARPEPFVLHQRRKEIDIVAEALDAKCVERLHLQIRRLVTRFAPCHQLGDHGVVEHRHLAAFIDAVVDPDAIDAAATIGRAIVGPPRQRRFVFDKAARAGQESAIGILCVDAVLDRPSIDADIVLRHPQLLASRNPDHLFDEVDTGDRFCHRMLDLKTCVHFEEIEALPGLVGAADDQFDRPGRVVIHRACQSDRLLAHCLAHLGRDEWRRGFLDNLLVAALNAAFAFVEIQDRAVLIAQDLDLDMARVFDELLDEDAVVAEGVETLALGRLEAFLHIGVVPREAHPLAAAACAGLHHHRVADVVRPFERILGRIDRIGRTGHGVDARILGKAFRFNLVAHRGDGTGRRADEGDVLFRQRFDKARPLGEEAVAGMNGLCARLLAGVDNLVCDEVALGRSRRSDMHRLVSHPHERSTGIGVRIDSDGRDAHAARGGDNPAGDLAAIGNQDFLEHSGVPVGDVSKALLGDEIAQGLRALSCEIGLAGGHQQRLQTAAARVIALYPALRVTVGEPRALRCEQGLEIAGSSVAQITLVTAAHLCGCAGPLDTELAVGGIEFAGRALVHIRLGQCVFAVQRRRALQQHQGHDDHCALSCSRRSA